MALHKQAMTVTDEPRVVRAVKALRAHDRDTALALLNEELREEPPMGERWRSIAKLAENIGEIAIEIEAARRFAMTQPLTLERLLFYWEKLAKYDRFGQIEAEVARLPAQAQGHPAVAHLMGTIASQQGDFAKAEAMQRKAIAANENVPVSWFALAMIKTFEPGDPDLAAMERVLARAEGGDPNAVAALHYGIGKARHDCGDIERAMHHYAKGAAIKRASTPFDAERSDREADDLIAQFTPEAMRELVPSGTGDWPAIFVNGLPRSGTTLMEQILASHSDVSHGGELNLFRAAMTSPASAAMPGALAYQASRLGGDDPWGQVGRTYARLLDERFPGHSRVVDKSLIQSRLMGLILHVLPEARVIWMRRRPEDAALSCYRTFFTADISWSWSFADIGRFFRAEDRLFAHWTRIFGDRIMVVPYEELVGDPAGWVPRIASHAGVKMEEAMLSSHKTARNVRTASVQQVRQPISAAAVGKAKPYEPFMGDFFEAYRG